MGDLTLEEKTLLDHLNRKVEAMKLRPPGFLAKAGNLAKAAVEHVAHGLPTVTDEERDRRLAICGGCEFYTARGTCQKCGCYMKRKAAWGMSRCPLTPPKW